MSFMRSAKRRFLRVADGDLLLLPQEGSLRLRTELGHFQVDPWELAVVPRGLAFQVDLAPGTTAARGYFLENFGDHFVVPDLGPPRIRVLQHEEKQRSSKETSAEWAFKASTRRESRVSQINGDGDGGIDDEGDRCLFSITPTRVSALGGTTAEHSPKYGYIGYGYGEDEARATTESHGLMQLNAYAAVVSELEEDTLGEEYAEAAHAAKNAPSQAKGTGKEKGFMALLSVSPQLRIRYSAG
ncbi:Homogentisate 1,2-dioxygenase [Symbiodinium microadriaticum]|uniref:homogentisate 1,2-dioxygenase n=1 Tax=Symbiodinium microadriaticum TaxID=2951 RepID=A0A1Q9CGT9_SYMMI|nr:Homogentisate 1,2-dioxygenase [Symbiodinium microadriaticum]